MLLLVLGVLLYAVGGYQDFLSETQATLLRINQFLGVAGFLSGGYVVVAAVISGLAGRRRVWRTILGVLFSSAFCAGIAVLTFFLQAIVDAQ